MSRRIWANAEEVISDLAWKQEGEFTVIDMVNATTYAYETCATALRGLRSHHIIQRAGVRRRLVAERRGGKGFVYRWVDV